MSRALAQLRARQSVEYFQQVHQRMSVLDLLQKMRNLLGSERRWCQFASAKAGQGMGWKCSPDSPYANRWDLYGAIFHHAPEDYQNVVRYDTLILLGRLGGIPVQFFNDTHSHAQIVELLDRAIEAEKAGAL